jgi:hypothetical protein
MLNEEIRQAFVEWYQSKYGCYPDFEYDSMDQKYQAFAAGYMWKASEPPKAS